MPWLRFNVCLITFHNVVRQVLKWPTYGLKLICLISATTSIDFRIFDGILWTRRPFKHLKKKTRQRSCIVLVVQIWWSERLLHFILFYCCCYCFVVVVVVVVVAAAASVSCLSSLSKFHTHMETSPLHIPPSVWL